MVRDHLAALGDGPATARAQHAAADWGVSYKTVLNYVGGARGERAPTFPEVDELAAVCAVAEWNVAFVLYGPPHPERVGQLVPQASLEEALGAHIARALDDATAHGQLPRTEGGHNRRARLTGGIRAVGSFGTPALPKVDGAAVLARTLAAELARAQQRAKVDRFAGDAVTLEHLLDVHLGPLAAPKSAAARVLAEARAHLTGTALAMDRQRPAP